MMQALLGRVSAGENLSMDEMTTAIDAIMSGRCSTSEIALLLTALATKGETAEEVAGAAAAMRRHMTPIRTRHERFIDTCGTGGDGSGTFNISTAAAIVTAAAGMPVAKHGNRKMTSKTGSADVLAELGVNVEASVATVEHCLDEVGIGFCFAQSLHPAMKHVAAVRRELGIRTIFNLLGPLCNPASAPFQLLGVGRPELRPLLSEAMRQLGTPRVAVVCGEDGLDEVTLNGLTRVTLLDQGKLTELAWSPEDFGCSATTLESLAVEDAVGSAAMIRRVLNGELGPPRDIVVMNSAAALWTAGVDGSLSNCGRLAARAIDSGAASATLERLAKASHAC